MTALRIQNIDKTFGSITAVSDVSFDIADDEFVAILGPSGSGKSTILRMIAGFETPTNGTISIKGQDVVNAPPFERDVNMVFQSLGLFPHLTVAENIAYGLKQKSIPKEKRKEQIDEMLEMVRLTGYNDRDPNQLSGGEQQRVALARALVNQPEIVLFDEPLASLDRKLRQQMQIELQRIQSEIDITFLYVTHDQETAMSVSDRLLLLNDGKIEQIGTAEELYESPASKFVANFIGDVNSIPTNVVEVADTELILETEGRKFTIRNDVVENGNSELVVGDIVNICIRPHVLELSAEDGNGTSDSFTVGGQVQNRIYKGDQLSYIVDTSLETFTVNTNAEEFDIGDNVYLQCPMSYIYLFPAKSDSSEGI